MGTTHADKQPGCLGIFLALVVVVVFGASFLAWLVTSVGLRLPDRDGSVQWAGEHLMLKGARSEELRFVIKGESVDGRWRTGPLTLRYKSPRVPATVVSISGEEGWDSNITFSPGSQEKLEIEASLRVPDFPGPERRAVAGTIMGSVEYPKPVSYTEFTNASIQLAIPISLQVAASEEHAVARTVQHFARLGMIAAIALAVIAFIALSGILQLARAWLFPRQGAADHVDERYDEVVSKLFDTRLPAPNNNAHAETHRTVVCPHCGASNTIRRRASFAKCKRCGRGFVCGGAHDA